ncbi:MAG: LysR substrate-binding domain-containing protein, partial [Rikenellaceae bacterium]
IPTFVKKFPKVELEICDMVTADVIESLKRDRIDAAIVAGGTCGDGIIEHDLFDDHFYAYVSPENSLSNKRNINIEDINIKDLVLLSSGNCMRDQVLELCMAKLGAPSHYSFVSGSIDTLIRIVDCTHCMTIIPEMALEYIPHENKKRVKSLANGSTSRKISVAVRRTYVKNSVIKALTDTILSCARGM